MTKSDKELLLKAGVIVAGYFIVVRPILQTFGIAKTEADKTVEKQNTLPNSENFFSPLFYKQYTGAKILTKQSAIGLCKQLYDAFGYLYDDEAKVFSVFRQLKTQSQVSYLSEVFQSIYKTDLLAFLSKGKGLMPQAGLSNNELQTILDIVKKLPKN